MSLISFPYIIFLPMVVLINFLLPRQKRYIWLFLAGYFFYLSNDIRYAVGLLFCTVTTYVAGLLAESGKEVRKKAILVLCIFLNILVLFLFRNFSARLGFVPVGFSFYMIQSLGYLIGMRVAPSGISCISQNTYRPVIYFYLKLTVSQRSG